MWRLCPRSEDLQKRGHQPQDAALMCSVEELIAEPLKLFAEDFEATSAGRVREAGSMSSQMIGQKPRRGLVYSPM